MPNGKMGEIDERTLMGSEEVMEGRQADFGRGLRSLSGDVSILQQNLKEASACFGVPSP